MTSSETQTFAARVAKFWNWFEAQAPRFYQAIEDKQCRDLHPEVSAQMDRIYPGAAWEFGPGENGQGHSFTFTGEGEEIRQLLTRYWLKHAPKLPGWTFYSARQRGESIGGFKVEFDGLTFDPIEFWLAPYVDEQSEKIDIAVWHPAFPRMENRARWTAIFLYLDETLGELGTKSWIGEIKIQDSRLADAMPLTEFASFVDAVVKQHDWKLNLPGEIWTSYKMKEPEPGSLRSDIIAGSTCVPSLLGEVEDGHIDSDPCEDTGADLVYVALPRTSLTKGDEVGSRGVIEDALEAALGVSSGLLVGGAVGADYAYIDLCLFDGQSSLKTVEKVLRDRGLGRGTTIEFFARSRSAERVVL